MVNKTLRHSFKQSRTNKNRAFAFYKIIACFACLGLMLTAAAQSKPCFVTGSFSDNITADVLITTAGKSRFQKLASFAISPDEKDFAFAIPENLGTEYRLQINLMNTEAKRPKLNKIMVLPLSLKPTQNYSLNITVSELDPVKKKGWKLKAEITSPALAFIHGKLLNADDTEPLSLCRVDMGEPVSNNNFAPSKAGEFSIPYPVSKEGFYYLASPNWRVRVYLRPSEQLQLEIDNRSGLVTAMQGSVLNQLLFQWQKLISPVTAFGYNKTEVDTTDLDMTSYLETYRQLLPLMDSFTRMVTTTDAPERKAVLMAMQTDRELAPLSLLYALAGEKSKSPGSALKDFADVPAFFGQYRNSNKFRDASLLALGEARSYLDLYARLNLSLLPAEKRKAMSKGERLQFMMNCFANDTLKACFLKSQLEQQVVNNLSEFRETFAPLQQFTRFVAVKQAYDRVYESFSSDAALIGKPAYDFVLPDTSGRMVSMKEMKGKVVFVDVWASWCGPCKKEFPFLKAVEEEYRDNKDLVFAGISIDRNVDKEKWLQMIRKENLAGVQLLDDGGQHFAHKYGVVSIPRFMLIDKQGRWIEVRCPRPTAKEELKRYLDAALASGTGDNAGSVND